MSYSDTKENTVGFSVLSVLTASIGLFGASANVYTFYVLTRIRIDSRLTVTLFKSQCLLDCFTCTVAILYRILPRAIHSGWWFTDLAFCYLWYADNIFWLCSIASVNNLLCLSLDRLVAVATPVLYRTHRQCLIVTCFTYTACFSVLLFIPNCVFRVYENGQCQFGYTNASEAMQTFYYYAGLTWISTTFLAPAAFMIGSHAVICYLIWKRHKPAFPADSLEQKIARNVIIRSKLKKVIVTTTLMVVNLCVCRAWDVIYIFLAELNLVVYASGSLMQLLGILFGTVGSAVNPLILAMTSKSISGFIQQQLSSLTFKGK